MKFLAGYVMRGPMQAILVTVVLALALFPLPPLGLLSGTAVALVTLRRGMWSGVVVSGGAALAFAVLSLALFHSAALGVGYLVVVWLPVLATALYLRRTVSMPRTLGLVGVFGLAMVMSIYASAPDPAAYWHQQLEEALRRAGQPPERAAELQAFYPWMTGAVAALTTVLMMATLFIARWWQALLYNPGGFQSEFHALRFGRGFGVVTIAAGVVTLSGGSFAALAGDALLVFMVLHLVHALAVIHGLVEKTKANAAWLVALYLLLLSPLLPATVVTLAALGFADEWFDFRSFFGKNEEV